MPKLSQEYHLCLRNLHQVGDANLKNKFEFQPQEINIKPSKGKKKGKIMQTIFFTHYSVYHEYIFFSILFNHYLEYQWPSNQEIVCLNVIEFLTRQSQCN
jgi:hypothetical protein